MTLTRTLFLALAVLLPTSWTVANAGDDMGKGGEMSKDKKKKGDKGDMGSDKGDMGKKGDMEKK